MYGGAELIGGSLLGREAFRAGVVFGSYALLVLVLGRRVWAHF